MNERIKLLDVNVYSYSCYPELNKCGFYLANPGVQTNLLSSKLHGALLFTIEWPTCLIYLSLIRAMPQSFNCKSLFVPQDYLGKY